VYPRLRIYASKCTSIPPKKQVSGIVLNCLIFLSFRMLRTFVDLYITNGTYVIYANTFRPV